MFFMFYCEIWTRDLQMIAICFYLHFTHHPNIFAIGVVGFSTVVHTLLKC